MGNFIYWYYMERLENIILDIMKRWRDKQFKKKILEYKAKINEQRKRWE